VRYPSWRDRGRRVRGLDRPERRRRRVRSRGSRR
jgi:hypothetical protein